VNLSPHFKVLSYEAHSIRDVFYLFKSAGTYVHSDFFYGGASSERIKPALHR
jgi:hypothetical protein